MEPSQARREPQFVDTFPLTETQQALMIGRGDAIDLGGVGCLGYFEWEVVDLDPVRMELAWRTVVDRHDMLRAVVTSDGEQRILSPAPAFEVRVTDLTHEKPCDADAWLLAQRVDMHHRVHPVGSWPCFDLRLACLPGGLGRMALGVDLQIMDACSLFTVLFPDVIDAYEGMPLTPLTATFGDHMRRQAQEVPLGADYSAARDYWLERVPTLPAAPALPARGSGGVTAADGQAVTFERRELRLPAEQWTALRGVASDCGVTSSELVTAVCAETFRLFSDELTFVINYPIFDRPAVEGIESVMGDFTNPILLVADGHGATFRDRLIALRRQLQADRRHASFNGVKVLRAIAQHSGAGAVVSTPVVVTSLLDYPGRRPVSDLGREVYSISQTPQVNLDVQIRELEGQLRVIWDFRNDAYDESAVDAAFETFCAGLHELADDAALLDEPRLLHLPSSETDLRERVNDTAVPVVGHTLFESFVEQATRRPTSTAISAPDRSLTYEELRHAANALGHRLLEHMRVTPGSLVAIAIPKGWKQYVAVYGILAAGCAYLPLDVTQPRERLARIVEDSGAVALVVDPDAPLPDTLLPTLPRIEVEASLVTPASGVGAPTVPRSGSDLAYVIYTSGSTGTPKGVAVENTGVLNLVEDVARRFDVTERDSILAVSGLHFDASVFDVFGVLLRGGTVVVPPAYVRAEPDVWARIVQTQGVTLWNSVPVLAELLAAEAEVVVAGRNPEPLSSLRLAVLSGDWIPLDLPARLWARSPGLRLVGSGGPTETICWSVFFEVTHVDPAWASIPYGTPIANQRYYIVDGDGYQRPLGVPGEMAVASTVGLARGYHGDPELTAARFVTLPETGERAYLTGDLGKYLPDGNLEILGRTDFQVKIRGHRIELGEIEAALRQDPSVGHAVVVAPPNEHGVRRLHAHVTGPRTIDPESLRAATALLLPEYMVPHDITVHAALPLTPNGKVDRLALSRIEPPAGSHDDRGPEQWSEPAADSALALVVAACAADVLGLASVTPEDNFFRLGGDSMSGTRLASLLRDALGVAVPIRAIFSSPVIGEIADAIAAHAETGPAAVAAAKALLAADDENAGLTALQPAS